MFLALAAAAAGASPARAQNPEAGLAREELTFIGWKKDECSAAFQVLRFAQRGLGLEGVPVWARIGSVTLPPGKKKQLERWTLQYDGSFTWVPEEADVAVENLARSGYSKPGYPETIRPEATASRPGLDDVLRSTGAFEDAGIALIPPAGFRLSKVFFSWLDSCALLVYRRAGGEDSYRHFLIRTRPGVRRVRARAHLTNGLLLYKNGDMEGGQAELGIAAELDPDFPQARFYNAELLAAQGRFDEALPELKAAVSYDKRLAEKARRAVEFEDLRRDERFKEALK